MNILENIFSITNKESKNSKVYKVITICGIKFKILNKYKTLLNILETNNINLENELKKRIKNELSKQNTVLNKQNNTLKKYEDEKNIFNIKFINIVQVTKMRWH